MRSNRPRSVLKRAGRFLYLNRTCWNGLYRVNLNGDFNVPIGTKDTVILSSDNFENIADLLREVDLRCADFEEVIDECGSGDFLFVDPPYTVQHNYNNFVKYNEKIFSWGDQIRLRDAIKRAISREASVAITNADHKAVRKLYEGICYYTQLNRYSILAGEASKRGLTTEALFLANIPT
jgi:DNA adenine methylase